MNTPHDHDHPEASSRRVAAGEAEDTGSRALAEALRSSFFFVKLVMVLLALAFVFAGARIVQPGERAVILRLGKPVGEGEKMLLGPGLHLAFPPPIDEIVRIPLGEIQTVTSTVGWYNTTAAAAAANAEPPPGPSLNPAVDGYVLTADTNIIHVKATLRYRVQNPLAYAFDFLNASNVVQNVLNGAVMDAALRTPADTALKEPATLKDRMLARVEKQVSALKLGITVERLDVDQIKAPRQVQADFDAVTTAEQARAQTVNAAKGKAEALVYSARSEAIELVNNAKAESNRYLKEIETFAEAYRKLLPEYERNAELFRQRLLAETMQRVLSGTASKFVFSDRTEDRLWIQLGREPEKAKTAESAK